MVSDEGLSEASQKRRRRFRKSLDSQRQRSGLLQNATLNNTNIGAGKPDIHQGDRFFAPERGIEVGEVLQLKIRNAHSLGLFFARPLHQIDHRLHILDASGRGEYSDALPLAVSTGCTQDRMINQEFVHIERQLRLQFEGQ
jgi:hypothetical protein